MYLTDDAALPALLLGLTDDFMCYNTDRPHPSLGDSTPDGVYKTARSGGASIVDKCTAPEKTSSAIAAETTPEDNRGSAVPLQV